MKSKNSEKNDQPNKHEYQHILYSDENSFPSISFFFQKTSYHGFTKMAGKVIFLNQN